MVKFNTKNRIEAEKSNGKDRKALYKLMNNAYYIQKHDGKPEKYNQWKNSKQQKRLFKMYIKTKV